MLPVLDGIFATREMTAPSPDSAFIFIYSLLNCALYQFACGAVGRRRNDILVFETPQIRISPNFSRHRGQNRRAPG